MESAVPRKIESSRFKILIFLLTLLACTLTAGCRKEVRVEVSNEDILRASAAAQEGDLAFNRKDYYAALIKYLESSRYNPNNEFIINKLGIAYLQLKYYPEATNAFLRAIKLNSKNSSFYNNLGSVYFAQKNFKKSEKQYRKAINMKPDEASFHMNLGSLYLERKQYEKGMAEWRKGFALDSNILKTNTVSLAGGSSADRRYFMARLMASSGDLESVLENLKQAITEGYTDLEAIRKEPDFDRFRTDQRFIDFMENAGLLIKARLESDLPAAVKKR